MTNNYNKDNDDDNTFINDNNNNNNINLTSKITYEFIYSIFILNLVC